MQLCGYIIDEVSNTAFYHLTSVILSWKSDILHENANW
jgi:hypothetical protein